MAIRGLKFDEDWTNWKYSENVNNDALSEEWLSKRTSYIYKVGVLCAIDANKCDWVYVAVGTQRSDKSDVELKGIFQFNEGENDDIGLVLERMMELLRNMHSVFDHQ